MGIYNSKNIENFKVVLIKLTEIIDGFAKHMLDKKAKVNMPQSVFNKILNRTRTNLESTICLLDVYKEQPFLFHSISHVFRALTVDFLNYCYLMCFYDESEEDFISFRNEYDLFSRDYLKALLEMDKIERLVPVNCPFHTILENKIHLREQNITKLKKYFSSLFIDGDISKNIKTAREIRSNSNHNFFDSPREISEPKGKMLSEKYKFNKILKSPFNQYADIFFYYKYFSQQYHFSEHSNLHAGENSKDENYHSLVWTIFRIMDVLSMQLNLLSKEGKFSESIEALQMQIENCLSSED